MTKTTTMTVLKIPLFLLAFTPIIFYSGVLFPYIFPKTIFIRLMVTIFWLGFVIYAVADLYGSRRIHTDNPHKSVSIRINPRLRNPIFLAVSIFILLVAISTLLAVNPYRAFWGDVERGEGFTGLLFFFGFFVASYLIFKPQDWKIFFTLTLFPALILFIDEVWVSISGHSLFSNITIGNPTYLLGSLIGNPTFLASFYLFVILAAGVLLAGRAIPADRGGRYLELLKRFGLVGMIVLALTGIVLSTTRGAIAGLAAGIVVLLSFLGFSKESQPNVRRGALILLAFFFLFVGIFVYSRHAPFWQKIPGLGDIAGLTIYDNTLQTRLIAADIALDAMHPSKESWLRFLFGWGPENFSIAYQKHYDPRYYRYEGLWFDRAHNKLLDVLVMHGAVGLIAYLMMWFFVFKTLLYIDKNQRPALLFFGVSHFVENLFAFENVSNYIPFFAYLSYVACLKQNLAQTQSQRHEVKHHHAPKEMKNGVFIFEILALLGAIFFSVIFSVTIVAFSQMQGYIPVLAAGKVNDLIKNFDRVITPYTYVQPELRTSLMRLMPQDLKSVELNATARSFLMRLQQSVAEAADRERTNARYFLAAGYGYESLGDEVRAEEYRKKAFELAPRRQDVLYAYALTKLRLGKVQEALEIADTMLWLDSEARRARIYYAVILSLAKGKESFEDASELLLSVFDGPPQFTPSPEELQVARNVFSFYQEQFYRERDSEGFLKVLERAKRFEERFEERFGTATGTPRSVEIQKGIEAFKEKGWSAIRLQK
jgi:O-antigen ligase